MNQSVILTLVVWTRMVATCVPVMLVSLDLDSSAQVCICTCTYTYVSQWNDTLNAVTCRY